MVDDVLEVHWKLKMATDSWTGEIETAPATYELTRLGGSSASAIDVYGVLTRADEIQWLGKALVRPDGQYDAVKHFARVNEIGVKDTDTQQQGFMVEVLTGTDAQSFISSERLKAIVAFLRVHWWKIAIGLVAVSLWILVRHD